MSTSSSWFAWGQAKKGTGQLPAMHQSSTLPDLVVEANAKARHAHLTPSTSRSPTPSAVSHSRAPSMDSQSSNFFKTERQLHDDRPFNVFTPTQNIVSACADPRRSRADTAVFFTRHWGDTFTNSRAMPSRPPTSETPRKSTTRSRSLPDPTRHIAPYLRAYGRRLKEHGRQRRHMIGQPHRSTSSPSLVDLLPKRDHAETEDALDVVPKLFLESDFKLSNRSTFDAVFLQPIAGASSSPATSSAILDEFAVDADDHRPSTSKAATEFISKQHLTHKLEYYHDLVESKLNGQLARKSTSFFTAVETYDALSTQLRETKQAVKILRSMIAHMNEHIVKKSLKALWLHRAQHNYQMLVDKMSVQAFLSMYDYPSALDVIATTQAVLDEDLKGVACFRHLSTQMNELHAVIGKMLQEEFVRVVRDELGRPLDAENALVLQEDQFNPVVMGLIRVREFRLCQVLTEESTATAKKLIRQCVRDYVGGALDDTASTVGGEKENAGLADQMRRLNYDEWMEMMTLLLGVVHLFCTKLVTIQCALHEIATMCLGDTTTLPLSSTSADESSEGTIAEATALLSSSDHDALGAQLQTVVTTTCHVSEERLARLLVARAKDAFLERLPVVEFAAVCTGVDAFVQQCDELRRSAMANGRSASSPVHKANISTSPLRTQMRTLTNAFVQRFHKERLTKLTNILDSEQWKASDVPPLFQSIVSMCGRTGVLSELGLPVGGQTARSATLSVNGDTYACAGTALLLVQMMAQYGDCVTALPFAATDLLMRLVELLKNFNSRTCQLILGAGALQLLGLKTITVKNLALASRCLQLILYHIPFVERHFKRYILEGGVRETTSQSARATDQSARTADQSSVMRHIAQVQQDYADHVGEIANKLTSVVDYQLTSSVAKWHFSGTVPSPAFQAIGRHMRKFYDGAAGVLPDDQLQTLMFRTHDNFKRALRTRLLEMDVTQRDVQSYALVCSEFSYYMEVLRGIPPCASLNDSMNDVMTVGI